MVHKKGHILTTYIPVVKFSYSADKIHVHGRIY